jgi:SAM-dependent methyltransferase
MNYFVTAAALKIASANALTRSAYHVATRLRSGARPVFLDRAVWLLDELPQHDARLLDLGTGWVHAYSLYPALLRDDEVHCFDVSDNRHFTSFVRTVPVILDQVRQMALEPAVLDRAARRAEALVKAKDFEEAYRAVRINYQTAPSGIPNYPDNYFDRIYSIDVLEHVDAQTFPPAAAVWYRIMKPGGRFLAQVGIDDHLAFYQGQLGSKRYLQYSRRTWDWLLGNDVQYINRLTASEIVGLLKQAGFAIDEVQTHSNDMSPTDVHPDYRAQSEDDIRAVRLFVKAHKPL